MLITSNNISPIAFFCFNRPEKTEEVLLSLLNNDLAKESEIFIFCDGPRNIKDLDLIQKVHEVTDRISGFKKINIRKRDVNYGVKDSIISGVNEVFESHDRVIVVEDDILCSKGFLKFINNSLSFYQDKKDIFSITAFNYPNTIINIPKQYQEDIFFVRTRFSAWGWGSWKDRWSMVDFEVSDFYKFSKSKSKIKEFNSYGSSLFSILKDQKTGKSNTWDIQISYHMFKNNMYNVYPVKPLIKNIGFDAQGTHTTQDSPKLRNFEFEDINMKLKDRSQIINNSQASDAYINISKPDSSIAKWFKSKKRRRNLKWFIGGIILGLAI